MENEKANESAPFWNAANAISIIRVAMLPLYSILIFGDGNARLAALAICPLIFILDYADGYIARKLNIFTSGGAFLDIVADRITEVFMWLTFLSIGMVPLWAPIIILSRGMLTDSIRLYAGLKGSEPYKMQFSKMGKFLVTSKVMRGSVGASKMILFTVLTSYLVFPFAWLRSATDALVILVVLLNLARGIPVIISGSRYLS